MVVKILRCDFSNFLVSFKGGSLACVAHSLVENVKDINKEIWYKVKWVGYNKTT